MVQDISTRMKSTALPGKVRATHLRRQAMLYVRQSSLKQLVENTESQRRQYALQERALALGWPTEQVEIVDEDLGQSGRSSSGRSGFQRLIAAVAAEEVGLVMGLEVSRLARNSADWHGLLQLCALNEVLILDEDGLYEPRDFNDRIVLGLKGAWSEIELHYIYNRLSRARQSKAERGELHVPLPVGLVYGPDGRVFRDPDAQVHGAFQLLFETYRRTGSACATARWFRAQGILFPVRPRSGPHKGELIFKPLQYSRVLQLLHNPRYAGAFCYGRTRVRAGRDGQVVRRNIPQEEWLVVLPDAHEGYLEWDEYQLNLKRLSDNDPGIAALRSTSPAREGSALLQGLVLCGRCGRRMMVTYESRGAGRLPSYRCSSDLLEHRDDVCQCIPASTLEKAVSDLVLELLTPETLDLTLAVQAELKGRRAEVERLRRAQVERARYEADQARLRYMQVDPANRLVAASLEADWNNKIRLYSEAEASHHHQRTTDEASMDPQRLDELKELITDFPRLWNHPSTPPRERKRLLRFLIEDITLVRSDAIVTAHLRLRGGATKTLTVPLPPRVQEKYRTPPKAMSVIRSLVTTHTDQQIAAILNARGFSSGRGKPFTPAILAHLRWEHGLDSTFLELRRRGLLTAQEVGRELGIAMSTISNWRAQGLLLGHRCSGSCRFLYERPDPALSSRSRKARHEQRDQRP